MCHILKPTQRNPNTPHLEQDVTEDVAEVRQVPPQPVREPRDVVVTVTEAADPGVVKRTNETSARVRAKKTYVHGLQASVEHL